MAPKTARQESSVLSESTTKANLPAKPPPASAKSIDQVDLTEADDTADGKENDTNAPAGKKRKAQDDTDQEPISLLDNVSDGVTRLDASCDQGLYDFLRFSKAMEGTENEAYRKAWEFFKKREIAGVKIPTKKQKTVNETKHKPDGHADLSGVELDGEADDAVPVYDTCNEVRKKIGNYLKRAGVTQASFCRDMVAQLHASKARSRIQGTQLSAFRSKEGPDAGNTSIVFYAAYVFFEKLRIKEGKPKSSHRQQMEKVWPGGVNIRDNIASRGYLCSAGKVPVQDEFGRVRVVPMEQAKRSVLRPY